ncbi:hypothetical protein GFS31_20880 [Leptolyngbya sp. BL0902]|uniref:alpha/beta hydrolase n=1 Tax=Leptolyngbya sp. BL0902 TaxID=1115757 RepID=UPI0018E7D915|nr:alpha/beta hydrolase [Leptolyngbya sp. BL0902]QQE65400.1 hypothetical protein GFS31_20880 [Leptolyngbya sp. BL0902]
MKPLLTLALTLAALPVMAASAWAAEEVLLTYRGFGRTVPISELETLAETGEAPGTLGGLLRQVGQNPQELQQVITRPIAVDGLTLDRVLNSFVGEWMLDQVGVAIRPPAGDAGRQALRSALVLSALDDNEITLLEVLQNYPTQTVVVDGVQIQAAYNRLATFLRPLSRILR